MELLWQALRQVVFILDQVAYGLIPSVYELIIYLANVNLYGTNPILSGVVNRIYLLLGIFMLFKVAFSMIKYLIDPGLFSDKNKGFGKLITNTIFSMVMLVMVPFLFQEAYRFQEIIITSNVIPRVILGDDATYAEKTTTKNTAKIREDIHSMGVDVQFALFSAFYNLNTADNENGYTACAPDSKKPLRNILGSKDMVEDEACWGAVKEELTEELHKQGGTLKGMFKYKKNGKIKDERDFATLGKLLWWIKAGGNAPFTINYYPIISAIAGGYLLLILITFAIDIAVRVFKLLFLQTIAPIAIISYMDPSESLSDGKFRRWLNECGKTYASLFIRLAVVYAAILLIRMITFQIFGTSNNNVYYNKVQPDPSLNIFIYVFLILGVFTFVKKVPQMIESIFNIKSSGELGLNPFKHEGLKMGLGAATVGGAALGAGVMSGASNLFAATEGTRKVIGSGLDAFNEGNGLTFRERLRNANSAVGMTMAGKKKSEWDAMKGKPVRKAFSTLSGAYHGAGAFGGILTGAVSGAARGASKGKNAKPSEIWKSAQEGLKGAREARIERDARQKQNIVSRFTNAYQEFSGTSGVGAQNSEINKQIQHLLGQQRNAEQAAMAQNEKRANMNISGFHMTDRDMHSHILEQVREYGVKGGKDWSTYSDAKTQEELAKMTDAEIGNIMAELTGPSTKYNGPDQAQYRQYLESHIQDMKETQSAIDIGKQIKELQASIGKKDSGGGNAPLK